MTNFEKYRAYMDGVISPNNYIDFGFYYLISAALQRRVWVGPEHQKLFPNMYIILVGEPGIGKGLVIKQISDFLKFHKLPEPGANKGALDNTLTEADKAMMEQILKDDYDNAQHGINGVKNKNVPEKPLLFPVAADATTYEALVRSVARSIRRINYKEVDEATGREAMKVYSHSSLCFCLEEVSSLFRKHTEDVVHFLIQAFDCGDYEYDTKTQGKDRIKRCCLSFFGGTTPAFMQDTFDDKLLTEGFASRTMFIYAAKNRKTSLFSPELTTEQKEYRASLLVHLEKLGKLYGKIEVEPSTIEFLEEWWKHSSENRPNTNAKLNSYYSRKNIHMFKMAIACHFGESTEMKIKRETFEKVIFEILPEEEKRMHLGLGLDTTNPLAIPSQKVLRYLQSQGRKTRKELLAEFWGALPNGADDMDNILGYLDQMDKVISITEPHPITKVNTVYYKSKN